MWCSASNGKNETRWQSKPANEASTEEARHLYSTYNNVCSPLNIVLGENKQNKQTNKDIRKSMILRGRGTTDDITDAVLPLVKDDETTHPHMSLEEEDRRGCKPTQCSQTSGVMRYQGERNGHQLRSGRYRKWWLAIADTQSRPTPIHDEVKPHENENGSWRTADIKWRREKERVRQTQQRRQLGCA